MFACSRFSDVIGEIVSRRLLRKVKSLTLVFAQPLGHFASTSSWGAEL